jgi:hypothetical protein
MAGVLDDEPAPGGGDRRLPRPLEWLFRDRVSGGVTIAQVPNLALGLFLVAVVVRRVVDPTGAVEVAVDVVAGAALAWWAIDEVVRGVNPWRRMLGAGVLAVSVAGPLLG